MLSRIALFCAVVACASIAGWSAPLVIVTVDAFTTSAPFTVTVSPADAAELAVGMFEIGSGAQITAIDLGTGVITLSSQGLPNGTGVPIIVAFITPPSDAFQVRYAANLNIGDSVINITNAGTTNTATGALTNICANVYTFSPDEQLVSCCSCTVTPNALVSLSANSDLVSNTLTPAHPTSIVVKIAYTAGTACNAANVSAANLVAGGRAWGSTLHAVPTSPVTFAVTETPFSQAGPSAAELARITSFCGFIQANGSGFGICKSCRLGGLGAVAQ